MAKEDNLKGKIVISKCVFSLYILLTLAVIVAVGLIVGLVGRPASASVNPDTPTTTLKPIVTTTPSASSTEDPSIGPWKSIRLPLSLIPYHYNVDLKPYLEPDTDGMYWFDGTSTAYFNVEEATKYIYIHSNKLEYSEISVQDEDGQDIPTATYGFYQPYEYLVVEMKNNLQVGRKYSLSTTFRGELSDDLKGLYRSVYTNKNGEDIVIAVSQMQPTDARKSFPCFDEPGMKATYDVSLWHKDPYYALSNMPNVTTEIVEGDWKRTTFETTFPMSTYLLAFAVCDFGYKESFTSGPNIISSRIYATEEQVEAGNVDYVKNLTPKILDFYQDFFDVDYPLPKSDQMAIPDFALGGMENWGLVMYRESALLYNPTINSAANKQSVCSILTHELSHQWFGDLITMDWWDELWLNEGFASYIEYLGANAVEPNFQMLDQFVVNDLHTAFNVDGLTTSRPIVAENVRTPDDINALFDDITYEKSGSVVRMVNKMIGDDAFKSGLKNYFDEFKYGSVNHDQLFSYWEQAVNADPNQPQIPDDGFATAMDSWVLQMGYPTVKMAISKEDSQKVIVTQERFLLDQNADPSLPTSVFQYRWTIPLWWKSVYDPMTLTWIPRNQEVELPVTLVGRDDYFIGNYEAFGYYRVNYERDNWMKIINALDTSFSSIEVKTRAQLIDDALNLARAGKLDYDIALSTTKFLRNDLSYLPWESATDVLSYFDLVLGRSKALGAYTDYLIYLVKPLYDAVAWKDVSGHLDTFQQGNAINVACGYGEESCVAEAQRQYSDWMTSGNNNISPEFRSIVYCTSIANGGEEEWEFMWDKLQQETDSNEFSKLRYGVTCSKEPWIISRLLQYTKNNTLIRKSDIDNVYRNLCYNEYARDLTWDFLRQEWDYIYEVLGSGFFSFSGIITDCTSHFSTTFEYQELVSFIEDNSEKLGAGARAAEQALESTQNNIQWRENNEDVVFNWLSSVEMV